MRPSIRTYRSCGQWWRKGEISIGERPCIIWSKGPDVAELSIRFRVENS